MTLVTCYIAVKEDCKCIADVVIDNPDARKQTAKVVHNWIRCGYVVERASYPSGYLPRTHKTCEHDKQQLGLLPVED